MRFGIIPDLRLNNTNNKARSIFKICKRCNYEVVFKNEIWYNLNMISQEIQGLIEAFAKLPGFGPRSAKRAVLHLLKYKDTKMRNMVHVLEDVIAQVVKCEVCGNLDTISPCSICKSERDSSLLCVVENISDMWALEKSSLIKSKYHILGGALSAIEGRGPEDLNLESLFKRLQNNPEIKEVLLAVSSTVEGQTTAYYIHEMLKDLGVKVTTLAQGVPIGAELDYLDEGTLITAFNSRHAF